MVLLSRMQLDERMRQEVMLQEARRARMAEEATSGVVKAAGPPKVQSQFFVRRFGHLVGRLRLQGA
jgi:hypothetical protein